MKKASFAFLPSKILYLGFIILFISTIRLTADQSPLFSIDYSPSDLRLPDYFVDNRVQLHTRLSIFQWRNDPLFMQAEDFFANMGAKVHTRWCKGKDEGAWWPSLVGAIEPLTYGVDLAQEMIDRAHNDDMHIILYHRHMEDKYMAQQNPDWICRDKNGNAQSTDRGNYLCMNSPYLDYFTTRMLELVDRGADGFYFDESHMPPIGCWCNYCKARFTAETGLAPPTTTSYSDPVYLRYLQFKNETIEEGFEHYIDAVHARVPGLPMVISINYAGWLYNPKLRTHLMRIAPSPKWEFEAPIRKAVNTFFTDSGTSIPVPEWDIQLGFAYTYVRDSAQGRPGHFWCSGLQSADEALAASSVLLTYGHIANLDIVEDTISSSIIFNPALELSKRVSPNLARTRPVRWAAIHFSEDTRDLYLTDIENMYRKLIVPCWQAFQTLNRIGAPIGTITDEQLTNNELEGYKVLLIPAATVFTDHEQQNLNGFATAGGKVITLAYDARWYTAGQQQQIRTELLNQIMAQVGQPPISMTGVEDGVHAVAVKDPDDSNKVIVCVTNKFTWPACVQENSLGINYVNDGPETPPPPVHNAVIFVNGPQPKKVFDLVSQQEITKFTTISNGIEIEVPDFNYLSSILIDYTYYDLNDLAELGMQWLTDNTAVKESGLVGWWKFDEGYGAKAMDSSGNNYNGTLVNMEANDWQAGIDGNDLYFDGTNEKIQLPDTTDFDFKGVGLTWSLFTKTNANVGQVLMSKSPLNETSVQGDKRLNMTSGGNIQLLANGITGAFPSTAVINDGQWHHIAMTIEFNTVDSNDTIKLYIDGNLDVNSVGTRDINKYSEDGFVTMIGNGPGAGFNGSIDNVKIFNRVLTRDEIVNIFNGLPASTQSYCTSYQIGDINKDCTVNFIDFALLAENWLK